MFNHYPMLILHNLAIYITFARMETKEERYKMLCSQIGELIAGEHNEMGVLANVSAAMYEAFADRYFWVGFYLVRDGELQLGPFQGPGACYRIKRGRGVCGTAWEKAQTVIVPDVEQFPGHIACSSQSRSEIVVPMFNRQAEVCGVLDIDSTDTDAFDAVDGLYLEQLARIVAESLYG